MIRVLLVHNFYKHLLYQQKAKIYNFFFVLIDKSDMYNNPNFRSDDLEIPKGKGS